MSIRIKIMVVIMLVAIAIVSFAISAGMVFVQNSLEQTIEKDMTVVADIADNLITTEINLLKADAHIVVQQLQRISPNDFSTVLRQLTIDFNNFIALTVFDQNGIVDSYGIGFDGIPVLRPAAALPEGKRISGPALTPYEFKNTEYMQRAFAGEAVISTTYINPNGELVFYLCVPMGDGRVLSAVVPGMIFSDILSTFTVWETGSIFILDAAGTLIANVQPNMVLERHNFIDVAKTDETYRLIGETFAKMIQGNKGIGRYDYGGVDRICVYTPITGSKAGWTLGVAAPMAESPLHNVRRGMLLVAMLSLLLSIVAAFFASMSLSRPYQTINNMVGDLIQAREEALTSTEAKSVFLANMSHEMRTPLNAIIGFSELELGKDEFDEPGGSAEPAPPIPQTTYESFEKIYTAGVTLLNLVNDILDISKIESGKLELVQEKYDLPSLINDTIVLNMVRIGSKPVTFNLDINENLPSQLTGDELRIKQLMNNLLSNAFKYTEEGNVTLHLDCQKEGDIVWMECRVSDTGKGIRLEDMDKLFANYSQVDIKKNRGIEGTGLGLALTKRLVEMMKGTVKVESVYGEGSTFSFRIQQGFVTDIPIGIDLVNNLQKFKYIEDRRSRNSDMIRHYMPYARVLVVDDLPTNLDVARGMMKPYGMTVDCVKSGIEAVQAIKDELVKYDAVFMDHQMPEMDGIEAVRIIRNEIGSEYAKTIPIIALTANAISGNDVMFLQHGFQAFLTKPIDIRKLNEAMNRWVRNKDKENALQDEGEGKNAPPAEEDKQITSFLRNNMIQGIHFEKALERFGSGESWLSPVRTFAASTPDLLTFLREVTQKDLAQYRITVHGIKGSSYAIGADEVGQMAEELEKAARNEDLMFIHSHKIPFITAAEALIGNLKALLEKVDENFSKPKKPVPDKQLLDKILEAAGSYNMTEMDKAMEELEKYQYESQGDIVTWLKEQIEQSEFEQIQERLTTLVS
ncbi:hypothetical protein AGMMS50293_22650 [Spirochaetia bacterium]|nr:hypothetical protein AGMMS50293_22650 [Spirochaetia bacterium]